MHLCTFTAAFVLATVCNAEIAPQVQIAELIFAEQSVINTDTECGRYEDVGPAAVAMRIFDNFGTDTCYTLARLLSEDFWDNDTITSTSAGVTTTSSCDPLTVNCTNTFQAVGINHFSELANYTQAQVRILGDSNSTLRPGPDKVTLKVFSGSGCQENSDDPWFSWGGCKDGLGQAYCHTLPDSVRSFKVGRETSNKVQCMIAAERGAGVQMVETSFAAVIGDLLIVALVGMLL
jgi:hypothetical protein